ncbi:MAG: FlgD immunoglobulin-like domain containing protein [Polyangiaceae bacterium]
MPIQGVSQSSVTTDSSGAAAPTLDREAFLKLLVAQLSHQDPLQPMQGTEFVTQLAQFSSVEQQIIQSQKLDIVSLQLRGIASNEATSLVGKTVTVRSGALDFDGVSSTGGTFSLQGEAEKTTVTIRNQAGEAVKTIELGPHDAGSVAIPWDGKNDAGVPQPAGLYTVEVEATDKAGKAVATTQEVTGTVREVRFDKGYPELILDSGVHVAVSDLISVSGGASGSGATPPAGGLTAKDLPGLLSLLSAMT